MLTFGNLYNNDKYLYSAILWNNSKHWLHRIVKQPQMYITSEGHNHSIYSSIMGICI